MTDKKVTQLDTVTSLAGTDIFPVVVNPGTLPEPKKITVSGIQANIGVLPGVVLPYAGSTAPVGYLLCQGQSVLRADYAELFTVIGTIYGAVDSTHFNLPDMRYRTPVGADPSNNAGRGALPLATTGGEVNHNLTIAELAVHAHTTTHFAVASTAPNYSAWESNIPIGGGTSPAYVATATTNTQGSGAAHNNMQPYQALNYIIKI